VAKEDIEDEASALNRLRTPIPHKNIVHVFRHGWLKSLLHPDNSQPVYFVDMELGRQSLEDFIQKRYRSVPPTHPQLYEIYGIVQQIASGITFIHQRGMVHRDLKPANSIPHIDISNE
jgi:serine/threonine protein kinase